MIFADKFIYLELAKTGSTYARYILKNLKKNNPRVIGKKHNVYSSLNKEQQIEFKSKIKIGNIRNPFDWYVSQFAFACEHRGGLYTKTQIRPDILSIYQPHQILNLPFNHLKNRKKWKEVFSDVNNIKNFELFLDLLFDKDPLGAGLKYYYSGMSEIMGFLSYDYFRTYTYNFDKNARKLTSYNDVCAYFDKYYCIDIMLRNENLINELLNIGNLICNDQNEMKDAINARPKKSKTATKRNPFQYYYSDRTIEMIYKKEQFIIDKYEYAYQI